MGNAGTDTGRFRTALNTGSYGLAANIAKDLPYVELADAIRLTCLAAEKDPARFEALTLRCLSRLLEERRISLNDLLFAGRRFQDAREGVDGETGLLNLVKQRPRA